MIDKACERRLATYIARVGTDRIVTWEIPHHNANLDYFKMLILRVTWRNQNQHIFGSCTFDSIGWSFKKQTAVSHSCIEAEVLSYDAGLRLDGTPALGLWCFVLDVFYNHMQRATSRDSPRTNQTRQRATVSDNESRIWILFFQTRTSPANEHPLRCLQNDHRRPDPDPETCFPEQFFCHKGCDAVLAHDSLLDLLHVPRLTVNCALAVSSERTNPAVPRLSVVLQGSRHSRQAW